MRFVSLIFFYLLFIPNSWAYPEFIGYGYSSCLTCHYNGQGNGPLNDYGRALWASEIAGRAFAGNKSDEELAAQSGFLGKNKLPAWLKPGVKSRGMVLSTQPFANGSETRTILMQAEANVALLFDKKSDFIFVGSYGYAPDPYRFRNQSTAPDTDNGISREHYVRWHFNKPLWLYFGMLDKVYGIRTVNHYAYSRSRTGLAQNDQAHSIIAHYIQKDWEFTFDGFAGNLFQDQDLRQQGASAMFEYDIKNNWKIGTSLLASSNDYVRQERFGIHSKTGLGYGASLLWEVGLLRDKPKSEDLKQGYYIFSQATQKLTRGLHLFFSGQAYKEDLKNSKTDNVRVSSGFIYFPRSRFELRIEAENDRKITTDSVSPDIWRVYSQLHISL